MKNKENLSQTPAAIRQRKRRVEESLDEREIRLAKDRENKRRKKALETTEQREARLSKNREQKQRQRRQRRQTVLDTADERLNRQDEHQNERLRANFQQLTDSDRNLLLNFRAEMNKIKHETCPICN